MEATSLDLFFRKATEQDNLIEIAELIYCTDDFIYPKETVLARMTIYLITLDKLILLINDKQFKYDYNKISRFLELYYEQYLGFVSKVNKVLK